MLRLPRAKAAALSAASCLLMSVQAVPVLAQATGAPPPQSAEELHAARRLWLQQQRQGDSSAVTTYRGARGPVPQAGVAAPPTASWTSPVWSAGSFGTPAVWPGAPLLSVPGPVRPPYDPAYPPFNRFYERFVQPPPVIPDYGMGMSLLPTWMPPAWYWGLAPRGCAELSITTLSGSAVLQVALPALGALTADELELIIDDRLSRGQPIRLQSLDGRVLQVAAGLEVEQLLVRGCVLPPIR